MRAPSGCGYPPTMLSQTPSLRKWRIAVAASCLHGLGESVLYGALGGGAVTVSSSGTRSQSHVPDLACVAALSPVGLDRLELLERLPAARAVAQRPAGRRAEDVLEPRLGRAAVRAAVSVALQLHECRRGLLRAAPAVRTPTRAASRGPAGVMRSVDHESSRQTLISGSAPSARIRSAIASRITSSAGQPRNVGVKSTRTWPFVDVDVADDAEVDERDHRDLRIRDLGQRVPDLCFGHHFVPAGCERRTIVISSQQLGQLGGVLARAWSRSGRSSSSAAT